MKNLGVFCGSSSGEDEAIVIAARQLGRELAARDIGLVFGGGRIGLMGVLADAALDAGGRVTGVIPRDLVSRELAHTRATRLHIVQSMHERKALMVQLSDAFLALPGGFGTLDELCEILTWRQLGIHDKPISLLNVGGFFDSLVQFFHHASRSGFLNETNLRILSVAEGVEEAVDGLFA